MIRTKDAPGALVLIEDITTRGYDVREYLGGVMEHLRNLLVASTIGSARLSETSEFYKNKYVQEAASFSSSDLLRLIKIAADTDAAIRWNQSTSGGRFKLEIGLLQM